MLALALVLVLALALVLVLALALVLVPALALFLVPALALVPAAPYSQKTPMLWRRAKRVLRRQR